MRKLTTIRLDEADRAAIATIKERYGVASDSDAIRLALRLLAESKRVDIQERFDGKTRAAIVSVQTVRKTYQEKLRPTPQQERALEAVLGRCRTLYNTALEQRWRQRGVSLTHDQQEAELKTLRAELPEYGDIHRHVLQAVLARLEKTYQAFFRRIQPSSVAKNRAVRASRARTAGSPSPTRSRTTAPASITAVSSCRRLDGSRCAGPAR